MIVWIIILDEKDLSPRTVVVTEKKFMNKLDNWLGESLFMFLPFKKYKIKFDIGGCDLWTFGNKVYEQFKVK